jgi:hypothetical protein
LQDQARTMLIHGQHRWLNALRVTNEVHNSTATI